MAIKNPWPNIKDLEFNDNTTLSSSMINAAFEFIKDQEITLEKTGNIVNFKNCNTDPFINIKCDIDFDENGVTGLNIVRTNENLFGGELLKDGIVASMSSATVDAVNKTVTFASGASTTQRITDTFISNKFKANTQYTFILSLEKTNGTGSNLRIYYTDGTYTSVPSLSGAGVKEVKQVLTTANKTVAYMVKANQAGSTIVYYDECGVFEGNISTLIPFVGEYKSVAFGTTIYGGYFDTDTGVLTSTKASDGTDLDPVVEVQLSTVSLDSLEGVNNIWHSLTGDTEVKYKTTIRCLMNQ